MLADQTVEMIKGANLIAQQKFDLVFLVVWCIVRMALMLYGADLLSGHVVCK